MTLNTISREDAIELFGSHLQAGHSLDPKVHEHLGHYEEEARNSGYKMNPGTEHNEEEFYDWFFHNTEEGLRDAIAYAQSKRIRDYEVARQKYEELLAASKSVYNTMRKMLKGGFRARVKEVLADQKDTMVKAKAKMLKDVEVVRLPNELKYEGNILPLGSKVYALKVQMKRGYGDKTDIIEIEELDIVAYDTYTFTQNHDADFSAQMYYNAQHTTMAQERGQFDGSIQSEDVGEVEIKTNVIGWRMFRTKSAAIAAGRAMAKDIIESLGKFAE